MPHLSHKARLNWFCFLTLLIVLSACDPTQEVNENRQTLTIDSQILGEKREVFISIPNDEYADLHGKIKYPVIYVLDGENMFDYTTAMINFLSLSKDNDVLPRSIIVGIPNTDRDRDLTPDPIAGVLNSGGGDRFLDFIEKELMPLIDEKFASVNHCTIIGHSYGGLLTIHSLFNRPELFDNYIAIDPSYRHLKNRPEYLQASKYNDKQFYLGIANTIGLGLDTSNYQKSVIIFL
ncbi:MAG: alpha/beta hydrolase-fold protein, partial [Bacteroidota bacterium]